MRTIESVAKEIALEAGEDYNDPEVLLQFNAWVHESTEEAFGYARWLFLLSTLNIVTVVGTKNYPVTSNFISEFLSVERPNGGELRYRSPDDLVRSGYDLDQSGTPSAWYLTGGTTNPYQINLWPVPSAVETYIVHVILGAGESSTASDSIRAPSNFLAPIRNLTRSKFYESAGNFQASDRSQSKGFAQLEALRQRFTIPVASRFTARDTEYRRNVSARFPSNY